MTHEEQAPAGSVRQGVSEDSSPVEYQPRCLLDAYSLHLEDAVSGDSDDPSLILKPLQADPATGRIVRGHPDIKRVIGFVSNPDDTDDVMTWGAALALGTFNRFRDAVVGKFPVVSDQEGAFDTIMYPITKITNNGVEL